MKPAQLAIAARAFARARWLAWRLDSRAAIAGHHRRELERLQRFAAATLPFYRPYAGLPFDRWPVMDKAALLADFAGINRFGVSAGEVRTALAAGEERIGGAIIGQSTGTSGNRGYYVIDEAERFVWLGTILAKALPDALYRRHRVALALPGLSSLYRSASTGSRIALGFFDLAQGVESWADELLAFAPDTIVAPPKVLRWLAETGRLQARHIFSGAEVLDPLDRAIIEAATGQRVREIYMATEGLFGVACAQGTLHLAEDVVHFEWERPDPASGLASPLVTDFTRRAQGLIRYRMNDLIELDDAPCPCGSAFQPVRRIAGRQDDVFQLADSAGALRLVTPDVLRNAVVDADPRVRDFRIVQTGAGAITVTLADDLPAEAASAVHASLIARLALLGCAPVISITRGIAVPFDRKLRRVRREWMPG